MSSNRLSLTGQGPSGPCCKPSALVVALLALFSATATHAAITDNLATSVVAMSLGNAVTADPPGIDSIHFNPAGLARIEGNLKQDAILAASLRVNAQLSQPAGFDIGGWKSDPLVNTASGNFGHTGQVEQTLFIPGVGVPKFSLPAAIAATLGFAVNNPGSPWTFATNVYAAEAAPIRRNDPNDPARYEGKSVVLQRLALLSPSVGYKISDTLRVGLAIPLSHQGFQLDTDVRFPNKLLGIIGKLQDAWCGDNGQVIDAFTFGLCGGGKEGRLRPFNKVANMNFQMSAPLEPTYNVGVLWEPKDWFALGAVYQSGSDTVLTGRYQFQAEPMLPKFVDGMYHSLLGPVIASMLGFPTSIPPVQSGNVTMKLPFPEHYQVGLKLKPIDRLQFNVDASYSNWSRWNKLTMEFDQTVSLLQMARMFGQADASKLVLPRGYKSVVSFGFGAEIGLTKALKLRLGYEPRKSSIPQSAFDFVAPLPDLNVKSIGIGYTKKDGLQLDATVSYARAKYYIPANGSCNLNCDNFFNVIYNPYAGLDVSGETIFRYVGVRINKPF
ncbi:MAG TPA: outer membrane protein transport protein [Aquabacterium sp.]|nr:outer membrane protein transport protein [Aquabacterium sp.]